MVPMRQMADAQAAPYIVTEAEVPEAEAEESQKVRRGWFVMKGIRGHTKKLSPLARQVAGKSVSEALVQMAFSKEKRPKSVKTAIERAVLNADFYHSLSPDKLLVERAWTGKQLTSVRVRHHSKGRAGMAHWRTSMLTVRLREMDADEATRLNRYKSLPSAGTKAKLDPRGY
jgi:large subunit ribosomal protein L22